MAFICPRAVRSRNVLDISFWKVFEYIPHLPVASELICGLESVELATNSCGYVGWLLEGACDVYLTLKWANDVCMTLRVEDCKLWDKECKLLHVLIILRQQECSTFSTKKVVHSVFRKFYIQYSYLRSVWLCLHIIYICHILYRQYVYIPVSY